MAKAGQDVSSRIFTSRSLLSAAKQSTGCLIIPAALRSAIEKYLREQDEPHMRRKVLGLAESLCHIKDVNTMLPISASSELVEDPFNFLERSKRWKIKSAYGDIGFSYRDDETVAYVASRMPAVFSACFRVLSEVRRRLPEFSPAKILDFGAGTGSAFWAVREVWPKSLEKVNLVEPSQSMQRAGKALVQGLNDLPIIHGYSSIQALTKRVGKPDRKHDLVIASYVVGEIPSLKDQITLVRQLWGLTQDVLVLIEPGTPQGSRIISRARSHILWMEKRKHAKKNVTCKDLASVKASSAYVVAPVGALGVTQLQILENTAILSSAWRGRHRSVPARVPEARLCVVLRTRSSLLLSLGEGKGLGSCSYPLC